MRGHSRNTSIPLAQSPIAGKTISSDHDGFVIVFFREVGEHKLKIKRCDDGDEIICEPPLPIEYLEENERTSLVYFLKQRGLKVADYTTYELMYSATFPDRYIFCLVRIDENRALDWADEQEIELEANARVAVIQGRELDFSLANATFLPGDDESDEMEYGDQRVKKLPLSIWEKMHLPYSKHIPHQDIYKLHGEQQELLENRMQLKILFQILTEDRRLGGGGMFVDTAYWDRNHPMAALFALHNPLEELRPELTKEDLFGWRKICSMWEDKTEPIRRYYGEEVGFYFAFLAHYTKTLFIFAAVGFLYFLVQVGTNRIAVDGYSTILVVLVGIIWSTIMTENWYRKESTLRFRWGMMRAAQTATPRPEFTGRVEVNPTTGELYETYDSIIVYYLKMAASVGTILLCISMVVSIVFGLWLAKFVYGSIAWTVFIGMVNAVQIQIMNFIYIQLAMKLNDWETHRLQQEYNNHLVIKKIIFYCVNSFNSLFIIAFIQPLYCPRFHNDPALRDLFCNNKTILFYLRIQLVTLFLTAIFINNMVEFVFPPAYVWVMDYLYERGKEAKEEEAKKRKASLMGTPIDDDSPRNSAELGNDTDMKEAQKDAGQSDVDLKVNVTRPDTVLEEIMEDMETQAELSIMPDMLDNMAELVVQYGYIMLFIVVFPLMPFLAVINNLVEMRVDLYNVINSQRPVPRSVGGIGVWKQVMSVFGIIAVFTNMGIICFRSDLVEMWVGQWTPVFFLVMCMIIIGIQITIRSVIDDVPPEIQEGILRQEYCEKYLIAGAVKSTLAALSDRYRGDSKAAASYGQSVEASGNTLTNMSRNLAS